MINFPTNFDRNKSYGVSVNATHEHALVSINGEERVLLDHNEVLHMIDMLKDVASKIAPPTKKWIGVDLDGTLAQYHHGDLHRNGVTFIGRPIPRMVNKVKQWLAEGRTVKIFTARIAEKHPGEKEIIRAAIEQWCEDHMGQVLEVTTVKDWDMEILYDDRAVQMVPNTGMTPLEIYRND
jgi:hypothetical protein